MNSALLITASGLPALLDVAAPHLEWGPLAPVFVLMAGACVAVLVEAFVPRSGRRPTQIIVTVATLVVAIAANHYCPWHPNCCRAGNFGPRRTDSGYVGHSASDRSWDRGALR